MEELINQTENQRAFLWGQNNKCNADKQQLSDPNIRDQTKFYTQCSRVAMSRTEH